MKCGCRKLRVDGRKCQPLSLRKRLDLSPALRRSRVEREQPPREANAYVAIKPALKCSAPWLVLIQQVDALTDFADGEHAEIKQIFRCAFAPFRHAAGRSPLHELGDDIRIEQVAGRRRRYHLIFLVLSLFRLRSRGRPPVGADRKNSSSESGCRAFSPARSKSSAGTITTASPCCLTTRCGPSVRARRNNSLKRALAS